MLTVLFSVKGRQGCTTVAAGMAVQTGRRVVVDPTGNGACVEVAVLGDDTIAMRNSNHPDAGTVLFTPAEIRAFVQGVKPASSTTCWANANRRPPYRGDSGEGPRTAADWTAAGRRQVTRRLGSGRLPMVGSWL